MKRTVVNYKRKDHSIQLFFCLFIAFLQYNFEIIKRNENLVALAVWRFGSHETNVSYGLRSAIRSRPSEINAFASSFY